MVRSPCCEKMGLKRGPWTSEEDEVLISHVKKYGHSNWRALPKEAGLLRCGKSCRLRWKNYLQPDIKRGNFTTEEEDNIIKLHSMIGNRWSAIAARLPGRTDNEIKNVWHTHLKKRLKQTDFISDIKHISWETAKNTDSNLIREIKSEKIGFHDFCFELASPLPSSSASGISWEAHSSLEMGIANPLPPPSINGSSSTESSSWAENSYQTSRSGEDSKDEFSSKGVDLDHHKSPDLDDCRDFWVNLLLRADELPGLPEIRN